MVIGTGNIQLLRNLDAIVPEWQELFARSRESTPFQSPAWLRPWWRCFGTGDPLAIAVRNGERLDGLGLFYFYDGDPSKGSQLFFLGKSVSDYLDILVAEDAAEDAAQNIFDCLFELKESWQSADFDHLRPNSPVLQVRAPSEFSEWQIQDGVCPELYLKSINIREIVSRNTRDALRKHMNRARSFGRVEFVDADEESLSEMLERLIEFHSARWRSVGLPGVFSDPKMVEFVADAGRQLLRDGMLQLHAMVLNGEAVAVAFGILHRDRLYFYLSDFNLEYATFSPGTLVTAYAMEQAARRGAKYFDFLRGEEEYKYKKWRAQPGETWRIMYSK